MSKYIFSVDKMKKDFEINMLGAVGNWVNKCEGKEAIFEDGETFGLCGDFCIHRDWCVEVEDE